MKNICVNLYSLPVLQEMHPYSSPGVMPSTSLHPVREGVKQNALHRG